MLNPSLPGGPTHAPGPSDALLRAVADNIEPCVFAQDGAGRLVFVNRSLLRWLERSEADLLGNTSRQVWPRSLAEKDEADLALVFAGARLETDERRPRAGRLYDVRSCKFPVCDEQGRVVQALTLFHELPAACGLATGPKERPREVVIMKGQQGGLAVSTVLVVERDHQVRGLAKVLLERGHHEVLLAADAAEARRLLEREAYPPDLILFDQGYAANLREMFELAPGTEVVLTCVMAPANLAEEDRGRLAGLLYKPFDLDEPMRTVRDVLRRRSPPCWE